MLYEIECDKFAEKINGEFVPRGRIKLYEGLNTVLGDKKGENSIGKSTFLLAIDFCFGGDDYLNSEINNVLSFVDQHAIKFAFKFGDKYEYYMRYTASPNEIHICDDQYQATGDVINLEDFKEHLRQSYNIKSAQNSWRSIVGRYSRIYGRGNSDEKKPLKYGEETTELAIRALEQLYGVYDLVKGYEDVYKDIKLHKDIRSKGTDIGEITTIATSKKQVKENEKRIEELTAELEELKEKEDKSLAEQDTENLDKAAKLKGQITALKRKRSRLVSKLNSVKINLEGGLLPTSDDIIELKEFFPDIRLERLETIENFHKKMQTILTQEMSEEVQHLEVLVDAATKELRVLEEEQRNSGVPTHISQKFLEQVVSLERQIAFLKKQNEGYEESKVISTQTSDAKNQMEEARETQLKKVETTINQEMVRRNDFIYDGTRYAPEIEFYNTRSGKPDYKFGCKWNTGTGENYKNLIIYDLSILKSTELPFLMHDSSIFKNIADLPIDKIMQLYIQSGKQIFISFDKKDAFTDFTAKTVYDSRVIELYDDGGELFGWSWAKKEIPKLEQTKTK